MTLAFFTSPNGVEAASAKDFVDLSTANLPGRLYVPPEAATGDTPRPLIVFLHGAGEVGVDNTGQINGNVDNLFEMAREQGMYLYAPQTPSYGWNSERTSNAMRMVDQILGNTHADPTRVYITGLSMGGGGTWNMLSRYPNRFAAGVPIAGVWPDNDFDASTVSGQPVWAFHARDDSVVSPSQSRRTIERLLKVVDAPEIDWPRLSDRKTTLEYTNADLQLSYTEWPTGGHDIWFRVYETQEMYDWMFAQTCETCPSIPASTPPQPQRISVNDVVYKQDFDEALGTDATDTTVALPTGWTYTGSNIVFNDAITHPYSYPRARPYAGIYNAGVTDDPDRALVAGISRAGTGGEIQFRGLVADGAASFLKVSFDLEPWTSRIRRGETGEAAFQLLAEIDTGDGLIPLHDFGIISTGTLVMPEDRIINGNDPNFRTQFASEWLNADLPEDTTLRLRWIPQTENAASWLFGLDNVEIRIASVPEPTTLTLFLLGSLALFRLRRKNGS